MEVDVFLELVLDILEFIDLIDMLSSSGIKDIIFDVLKSELKLGEVKSIPLSSKCKLEFSKTSELLSFLLIGE